MRSLLWFSMTALAAVAPLCAQTEWRTVRLEKLELSARLINDVRQIEQMLGDDLDEEFILIELKLRPFYDTHMKLSREDFLLKSRADNETSHAQSPSRIAGSSVLALGQGRTSGGGVFGQAGPVLGGGLPGIGQRPTGVGNGGGGTAETTVNAKHDASTQTLVERLEALELPLDETNQDISGYLYFQVNPKNKLKRLVFYYDGPYGEAQMQFDK
ncbi:MAG: hypothetical protein GC160_08925 [Acidobacteria bacterium]|nr:hypothetical protein [Acidobacteriota bacterium]